MMTQEKIPAVFVRGGTSKGVFFHAKDLPASQSEKDQIFLKVLGSPDPYQRQLNGMGGGLSSVSKVAIIERSTRPDADVDYTFVQIAVDKPIADYGQACGNLSASVGPFAIEEGLLKVQDGEVTVRVYNTNTDKIFHAHFHVRHGRAVEIGDFEMSGVAGSGAKIKLDYIHPGGAKSAAFLPTGHQTDSTKLADLGLIEMSLIDATNPVVFVRAVDFGITGHEAPDILESNNDLMSKLDIVRRQAGVMMGLSSKPDSVALSNPKIALLSTPADYQTISGEFVAADQYDIGIRIVSMERMHRAVTGTGSMCLAAGCQVVGSLPHQLANNIEKGMDVRIGTPSGVMVVAASASQDSDGIWHAHSVTVYRTQRRLMEGFVVLPRG